jgi:hypothetical protein
MRLNCQDFLVIYTKQASFDAIDTAYDVGHRFEGVPSHHG